MQTAIYYGLVRVSKMLEIKAAETVVNRVGKDGKALKMRRAPSTQTSESVNKR